MVGFFADDEGTATIEPLSSENASQAVMAGVISRSAYVEAHAPSDKEKGWCLNLMLLSAAAIPSHYLYLVDG